MSRIVLLAVTIAALHSAAAVAGPLYDRPVYFTSRLDDAVRVLDTAGSVTTLLSGPGVRPWGIALDEAAGHLYFANGHDPADGSVAGIRRMNLDGSGVTTLVGSVPGVRQIELDLAGGRMYWAAEGDAGGPGDSVYAANLDGSGAAVLAGGLFNPRATAFDPVTGRVYWDTLDPATGLRYVERANADGSGRETVLRPSDSGWGFDLDPVNRHLYLGDVARRRVVRTNLDGTGLTEVLAGLAWDPLDIKIDPLGGWLYVSGDNPSGGGLLRSRLDGTAATTLLSGYAPTNITLGTPVVPEPGTLALMGIGGVGMAAGAWRRRRKAGGVTRVLS